jgi:valacyclovir hydrolase
LDFGKILETIDKTKFKLVAWDPPGYGYSRPPDREFTKGYLKRDAELASELMEELGFLRYSILGWSQGGQTGILLAAMFPAKVVTLTTLGASAADFVPAHIRFYSGAADLGSWPEEKLKEQLKYHTQHYLEQMTQDMLLYTKKAVAEKRNEVKHACPKVTCPVLVMHAQEDHAYPLWVASGLQALIPGAKLYIFPEGKHDPHLTHTEEFMKEWTRFVLENAG